MGFFIAGFLITTVLICCFQFVITAVLWVIGFILGLLKACFPASRR